VFGLSTFAELIFADLGHRASVNDGWQDVPRDPCDEQGWIKRPGSCAEVMKVEKKPSNWTVIK